MNVLRLFHHCCFKFLFRIYNTQLIQYSVEDFKYDYKFLLHIYCDKKFNSEYDSINIQMKIKQSDSIFFNIFNFNVVNLLAINYDCNCNELDL